MSIFPRPVAPRAALSDLWSYLTAERAHKWPLMGLSAALTYLIVWAFITDANTNTMPTRNKINYIRSWDTNRSDATIILQQKQDLAQEEIKLREDQKRMQKMADMFGVEWRKDAERNAARRAAAIKRINAELDARLAKAESQEQAQPVPVADAGAK